MGITELARFYVIFNKDIEVILAWPGLKIETHWFYGDTGSFLINIMEPNNEKFPSVEKKTECVRPVAIDSRIYTLPIDITRVKICLF